MTTRMHLHETRRFSHDAQEIGAARGWVRHVLGDWGLGEHAMALELAVSELVTNAIVHGEGAVGVTLDADAGQVRLVVSDEGHGHPRPRPGATLERGSGGWGLGLVADVADGWGTTQSDEGTSVWVVRRADDL